MSYAWGGPFHNRLNFFVSITLHLTNHACTDDAHVKLLLSYGAARVGVVSM